MRLVEAYPELPLADVPTAGLAVRDAALAHAIVDAVVRRWITLEAVLQTRLDRPFVEVDAPIRAALLAGTAQMFFLDKVPPHAAIFETVEWVKRGNAGAGGYVNGVLRALSRILFAARAEEEMPAKTRRDVWGDGRDELPLGEGGAIVLGASILPSDREQRWSLATGHPLWLVKRWVREWGDEMALGVMRHDLITDPPTVFNTAHAKAALPGAFEQHENAGCHVFSGSREGLLALVKGRADIWVQDVASTLAVRSAAEMRPERIVDLCAGRGTKTRQLAAVFGEADIVASDPDAARELDLRRVAMACPKVRVMGPAAVANELKGWASMVLTDVPCTNTGVLPRRPEARYRCDQKQLERLVALQRTILTNAKALLAPGGILLYSTCSVEREENEEQAAWAAANLGLTAVSQSRTMPAGEPGGPATGYHDGAFSAILRA